MNKTGRNDPCHCGSGQKYKRCCLQKDHAAERATLAATAAIRAAKQEELEAFLQQQEADLEAEEALTQASNAALDLIRAGKLDEAEQAARDLLVRFPDVHDGYDRLGKIYEARGNRQQAAEHYRKVVEFVQAHPDQYEPGFETHFQQLIRKLDTPTAG
jgi:tetratricopeptide (TPR) repeat protein